MKIKLIIIINYIYRNEKYEDLALISHLIFYQSTAHLYCVINKPKSSLACHLEFSSLSFSTNGNNVNLTILGFKIAFNV